MDVIFKTFNVGNGDCIALLLSNNGQEIHILVDCGKFTAEVNELILQHNRLFDSHTYRQ